MRGCRRLAIVGIALLVVAATSCGDDDSSGEDASDDLRPAEEVEASEQAAGDEQATLGTEFNAGEVAMLIDSITVAEEPDTADRPFLVVHVRSENSSDVEQSNPEIGIVCAGSDEPGSVLAYSTWSSYEALPPDTFRDGFVWLTGPGDPRTGEPTTDCAVPAALRVQPLGGESDAVAVPLGDDVVAALNDDGCASRGTEVMAERTIVAAPVVCASFGDGPTPDTQPA